METQTVAYSQKSGLSPGFIEKYNLSGRQADVIEVLLRGKSDKEIAASLEIASNTVQTHLKKVYRKTGTSGRFALMALVVGLVSECGGQEVAPTNDTIKVVDGEIVP